MNQSYPRTYRSILLFTLLFGGISLLFDLGGAEIGIFIFFMVATGIPHGATDHVVDRYIQRKRGQRFHWGRFLFYYLGAILLYTICWIFLPLLSLVIFLLISAFHFGQSQLLPLKFTKQSPFRPILYILWGGIVLWAIVGFHPESSGEILGSLFGQGTIQWELPLVYMTLAPAFLAWLLLMVVISVREGLSIRSVAWETFNLLVLIAMSHELSLLMSFALYFGLWHSMASISHEIHIFRTEHASFSWKSFAKDALPFSLISFGGIVLLLITAQILQSHISPYLLFFIAISVLTLPHMVFMDRFYRLPTKQS
ncbi:MAG: Brp/Blh family beta-carotene 15,15'-dioxygenase, partial [Bacteroidota bacterium]